MAGLDPAIQTTSPTATWQRWSWSHALFLCVGRRDRLDGRVKPGHDGGED